jgi:hypothetical protein
LGVEYKMTEKQDNRKTVKVTPEVKEALAELKEEWHLSNESDVIAALIDLFRFSDELPKPFLSTLIYLRK